MGSETGSDAAVLVIRVWHEQGFRARIMTTSVDGKRVQQVVASEEDVVDYVQTWLKPPVHT